MKINRCHNKNESINKDLDMSTNVANSTVLSDLDKSGSQQEIDVSIIEKMVKDEELNKKTQAASNDFNEERESVAKGSEDKVKTQHKLSTFIVKPEQLTQKPIEPEDQNSEWFHCGDCGARFSSEEILEEHVVKHTGKLIFLFI